MKVTVKQKMWTLGGSKYDVLIQGEKKFLVASDPLSIKSNYEIKDYNSWERLGSIKNESVMLANAFISIAEKEYRFSQENIKEMTYECLNLVTSDTYLVQGNKGSCVTVYKNHEQIAYWRKKSFIVLKGHRFNIEMNYDEDPLLVSLFAILVNRYSISVSVGGDIGWFMGNTAKGLTDFNEKWRAKER